ncbi:TetR/AcrR family transcriptional regulator [Bdellovibrio sp. ZAP7]|uniref:TetR/AcrR family transcriptional regulator n=1 Tax=Bdellovibrio sp. ZAP7 TaxID=2231053 RepID=UPI00115AFBEC|nr:TetR/AcrR family transcriptional regulator [Bdellovibrio sp. ZAP7]QDK47083.1 TetR/AcrR family transcriptional regulator [Bdellovibrio sp. ZAP7]
MRYEKGHKEKTKQHILNVASREFRKGGIESVGLSGLMESAGLTNGAFYAHFKSKEDLVCEVLDDTFKTQIEAFKEAFDKGFSIEDVIKDYLSPKRRDNCGEACIASALTAEIARHPKATRKVFDRHFESMVQLLSSKIAPSSAYDSKERAISLYAQLVGTLQLSRVIPDVETSNLILKCGIESALKIVSTK